MSTQGLNLRYLNGMQRGLRSHRPKKSNNEIIEKNLQPLKQNTKKKLAQSIYYKNHPKHQSPLIKEEKGPVHQRLGVKQIRLKRLVPLGTNTSAVLPKKKFFRHPNEQDNITVQNSPAQFKRHKQQRAFSAQSRIERIQAQQRNNNYIKLRRLNATGIPPAANLTVHVKNPSFVPEMDNGHIHTFQNNVPKFKMTLNPEIQAEILEIQSENGGAVGNLPPLTRITPVTTNIPITTRFSLL